MDALYRADIRQREAPANRSQSQPGSGRQMYPNVAPRSQKVVDLTASPSPIKTSASVLPTLGNGMPGERSSSSSTSHSSNGTRPPMQSWALPSRSKHAGPSKVRMFDASAQQGIASNSTSPTKGSTPSAFSSFAALPRASKGNSSRVHDAFSLDSEVEVVGYRQNALPSSASKSQPKKSSSPAKIEKSVDLDDVLDGNEDNDIAGMQLPPGPDASASASERDIQLQNMLSSMVLAPELGDIDVEKASKIEGLRCQLLPHQVAGYLWLKGREAGKYKGGILADDMGLGKTIQTLALLIGNSPVRANRTIDLCGKESPAAKPKFKESTETELTDKEKRINIKNRTSLVIAPLAVIRQWEREIKEKSFPQLRVLVHHGPQRTKSSALFRQYDVVITTYTTAVSEFNNVNGARDRKKSSKGKKPEADEVSDSSDSEHLSNEKESSDDENTGRQRRSKNAQKKAPPKPASAPLFDFDWLRIILDEAQNIKNHKTQMSIAAAMLGRRAVSKWCLSGTPIQNDCLELFSLIRFLGIPPFDNLAHFKEKIADPLKSTNQNRINWGMKRLCAILSTIMLRRTKDATHNGKPLLTLPNRIIRIVSTDFDDDKERQFYNDLEDQVKRNITTAEDEGKKMNHMVTLLMLLRLRQACNHPLLLSRNIKVDAGAATAASDEKQLAGMRNTADTRSVPAAEDDDDGLAALLSGLSVVNRRCDICQVDLPQDESRAGQQHCATCRERLRREVEGEKGGSMWSGTASTKIRAMLSILDEVHRQTREKTIVFSQFTSFLDLIEPFLRQHGYKYSRYDGSLRPEERESALDRIRSDEATRIILISFKAGNTGLNLTSCSRVILMDLWWNPMLEAQAIDRSHRLGQTHPVIVYKLVIQHSVEERILALQDKKRALAEAALEGSKLSKQNRLDRNELMYLFSGGPIA